MLLLFKMFFWHTASLLICKHTPVLRLWILSTLDFYSFLKWAFYQQSMVRVEKSSALGEKMVGPVKILKQGEGGGARIRFIRPQESLVLYKSFHTLRRKKTWVLTPIFSDSRSYSSTWTKKINIVYCYCSSPFWGTEVSSPVPSGLEKK